MNVVLRQSPIYFEQIFKDICGHEFNEWQDIMAARLQINSQVNIFSNERNCGSTTFLSAYIIHQMLRNSFLGKRFRIGVRGYSYNSTVDLIGRIGYDYEKLSMYVKPEAMLSNSVLSSEEGNVAVQGIFNEDSGKGVTFNLIVGDSVEILRPGNAFDFYQGYLRTVPHIKPKFVGILI